ncbi:MAG: Tat pathway signal protein [Ruminococcaceae bacterium]|nr:Tat pathway signal protein [Oscillospiraceae bacterium]
MNKPDIWAYLIHLGSNMWYDEGSSNLPSLGEEAFHEYRDYLLCDEPTWDEVIHFLPTQGINTLIIDLGEGVAYDTHPELAVPGTWSKDKLRRKLDEIRALGMEPIPKINFSACHDAWMKEYSRMLSTDIYRQVAADLIAEVSDLFDHPRYFHIGMDEETAAHQQNYAYTFVRAEKPWWSDFYYFVDQVEKAGARPWVWSDYYWEHPDLFRKHMPKDVLQSNWYYGDDFFKGKDGKYNTYVQTYVDLDEMGYDQVPTGSTWGYLHNEARTVLFCRDNISPEHLKGFMTAPWMLTVPGKKYSLIADAAVLADARRQGYEK